MFLVLFVGRGLLFLLQKQHEKRAALEAKRRAEAALKQVAHTYRRFRYDKRLKRKKAGKTLRLLLRSRDRVQCCPAYADAAETYAGSGPNALTSVLGVR